MPFPTMTRCERALVAFFVLLVLAAVLLPALTAAQSAGAHFADERSWHGIPNALDVISNLPFAALGGWGLWALHGLDRAQRDAEERLAPQQPVPQPCVATLDCAWMFFAGLILTAAGSAFYHLAPDGLRLAADRAGMAVAFAGLIGCAVCERIGVRAGWPAAWVSLGGGLLAVTICQATGNVLPWGLVQFGGMTLVLALAAARPVPGALGLRLGWVIAFYMLAKLFEVADLAIYEATGRVLSGHSLKHLVAAMAALPVLYAVQSLCRRTLRHNPGAAALTA